MIQLEDQLQQLEQEAKPSKEGEKPPRTSFDVLGHQRDEGAWQAYLGYFLDPTQPHGLEHNFLHEFLSALYDDDALPFELSEFELRSDDSVEVELERSTPSGVPDIVLYSETSWFLCMELKLYASEINEDETWQTERYAAEQAIAPPSVDEYEDGGYVYLKPSDAPDSKSGAFADVAWEDTVPILRNFIANNAGALPNRTLTQLAEFADHIETELNMTSIDETTQKRKDLYFEYRDAIHAAEAAIEPFVEDVLQQNWAEALQSEYQPESTAEQKWLFDAIGHAWGQVYSQNWVDAGMDDFTFDLHFEHKPAKKYFKQGQLKYLLELEEPDRATITPTEGDRYYEFRADILSTLPETTTQIADAENRMDVTIDPGQSKKKLLRVEYSFTPGDEDEYYATLGKAIDDCVPVAEAVTELLQSTDYTNYPLES